MDLTSKLNLRAICSIFYILNVIILMVLSALYFDAIQKDSSLAAVTQKFEIYLAISIFILGMFIFVPIASQFFFMLKPSMTTSFYGSGYFDLFKVVVALTITYSIINSILLWKELDALIEHLPKPITNPLFGPSISRVFKASVIFQGLGSAYMIYTIAIETKEKVRRRFAVVG